MTMPTNKARSRSLLDRMNTLASPQLLSWQPPYRPDEFEVVWNGTMAELAQQVGRRPAAASDQPGRHGRLGVPNK